MKNWYHSRTLWLNIIAAIGFFVQHQFGFIIPPDFEMLVLGILNAMLRLDTSTAIGVPAE